jgi:asparagine synthase (glutamine-hydrolysing)
MCGIAGIFSLAAYPARPVDLQLMSGAMKLRGPDGEGVWQNDDGRVRFAHRRLSIIDVNVRANQPMTSEDGRFTIVFNGEIYNYQSLRDDLAARGSRFQTTSDTEVLLELFRHRGVEMLSSLRGMFAFAIWDASQRCLTMARDPYGIKPLYYTCRNGELRFASQVKALLAGGVTGSPDPAGIVGFHLFGNVPEPFTFIDSIRALAAGCYVVATERGIQEPKAFASVGELFLSGDDTKTPTPHDAQETIRSALISSVNSHLVADVPVGLFLSAGIDSGALLGLMRDARGQKVSTVTLGFDEFVNEAEDESVLANDVAQFYGADHYLRKISRGEFFDTVPAILTAMDQPTIDGVNTYFVSKAANEIGLKVAISGTGGDELFGGYSHFSTIPRDVARMRFIGSGRTPFSLTGISLPRNGRCALIEPKIEALVRYGGSYPGSYLARRCLFTPHELSGVMNRDLAHLGLEQLEPLLHINARLPSGSLTDFSRIAILESTIYLRNQLLRDADWAGMANSVEVRLPLVDTVLLSEAAAILRNRAQINKQLLANAPSRPVPDIVKYRKKTGFATPLSRWLADTEIFNQWRECPVLRPANTKWAKRWAYIVSRSFVGDIS